MIEHFDVNKSSQNLLHKKFVSEHRRRYEIASAHIGEGLVIDAACGAGYGCEYVKRYIGMDNNNKTLLKAQERYPDSYFEYVDLAGIGIFLGLHPDNIICFETAEHLSDPKLFLMQVYDALPVGGKLLFSVPTSLTRDFDPYHRRDWPLSRWMMLLTDCGFGISQVVEMPIESTFLEFYTVIPTTCWQKIRIGMFLLTHPFYLVDRIKNWCFRNRFYWCTHLLVCVK